ncbi:MULTISPECIES: T9SS type A sorting domain-containing protein [Aequorivita]|uniref:T9SS type A sorting domain-containing protein n=1 Tax=Aequorivita iocasae TaxID=2803865 RepID=A0ABX7DQP0_9FLAO|nr:MULTISPECIES: T9SS type A sorting domain-containing protein [Aequorivita]QQX75459.1 T9SS type A sorting domain-containing protein [Aequorivita iocasae]UCA54909.1 T9SS type A sorting domain-containing protein [Aequorivita sp. F7]
MKHLLLTLTLLTSFFASGQIVNIPDTNFKNALLNHNPVIDTNGDGEIQYSEAEAVEILYVLEKAIIDLTGIETFENLKELNCQSNFLNELNISSNISLERLICYNNNIQVLNISNNPLLQILQISSNNLTTISASNNANLEEINCDNNNLTTIDVSQFPNITNISCSDNNIVGLDVSNNQFLEILWCFGNEISELDVSQNPNVRFLWVSNNELTNLNLENNLLLETFYAVENPISNFDFSSNINLRVLNISNTLITELDLSNNPELCNIKVRNIPSLEYINLKNGNTEVLGGGCTQDALSLTNNPNLQFICVEDAQYAANNFTDIPPLATFVEDCTIANGDLNHITGTVKYDDENNGCDGGDVGVGRLLVNTTDGTNNFATTTINTGDYNLTVAENTYTTTVLGLSPYFSLSPAQAVDTFVGFNQTEIADFCIAPTTTANDLAVTLVPLNAARPGFEASYKLVYENVGTTQLSGNVELDFDGMLVTFVEATPTETSINGNTISWDYSNLNPFETRSIEVVFEVAQPPIVESGDVLPYIARVNPVSGDAAPDDNVFQLNQIAVNSFDPNDKQVLEGYQVLIDDADEYLHYVVRFQNMGTANAINVRVQDALDEKLDWTTFKVLDASHAMKTQLVNGSIDFIFDNINLPTASSDPEGSQGFVAFKVKPVSTVQLNDVVANAADIYFDFNAAIVTNTVFTTFVDELAVADFESLKVVAFPNPANDILNIQAEGSISSIEIVNILGQTLLTSKGNSNREQIDISGLSAGNYFVRIVAGNVSSVLRIVKK